MPETTAKRPSLLVVFAYFQRINVPCGWLALTRGFASGMLHENRYDRRFR